jgi:O-antigen ligase
MRIKNSYSLFFEKISPYLICSMLPLLISGPFLPDLIVTVVALLFVINCFINKNFSYFNNIYFKIFLLFYFICFLSAGLSDYPFYSLPTSFFYIRFAIFSTAFYFILQKNTKIINYLFYILLVTYLILVLDSFQQYLTGYNIIGIPKQGVRLSSFFGSELIIGSYLSRLAPLLIALYFLNESFNKKKINILFFWFLIFLSFVIVFLSGERASFFFTILLFIYLLLMLQKNFIKIFILTILFILSIILINKFDLSVKNRMFDQTKKQMGLNKESEQVIPFSNEHHGHYLVALDLFKKNPVYGVGPKNFRKHCFNNQIYSVKPYICTSHPHNTYIQLLAETGILGFLIIFSIFISISYYSLKHLYFRVSKNLIIFKEYEVCLLASFVITLWPIVPTGNFFNNFISIIYFYPIAIFFWKRKLMKIF